MAFRSLSWIWTYFLMAELARYALNVSAIMAAVAGDFGSPH